MAKPKPSTKSSKATKSPSKRAAARAAAPKKHAPAAQPAPTEPPRSQGRTDDADAFIRERGRAEAPSRSGDDLAEVLGEDFLESATRGNEVYEDDFDATLPDEVGGPFVVTNSGEELADDVDESNPPGAEPAGRPKAVAGLVQRPRAEEFSESEEEGEEEEDEDEEDDEDEDEEIEDELSDEDRERR